MSYTENKRNDYKEILGTSFITGGAQLITTLSSLIRVKFASVLLGVSGFGLAALLFQSSNLIQTITGLGIGTAGVRAISLANSKNDENSLEKIYYSIKAWSWILGLTNLLICILFSKILSEITFGNSNHSLDFILLGIAAFLNQLSQGQMAILRGLRKIKDIALRNIRGTIIGLILTIPFYYFWGVLAIAPGIVLTSAISLILSWLGVRQYRHKNSKISLLTALMESSGLIKTGLGFIGSSIAASLTTYLISMIIRIQYGTTGNGYYQAASAITIVMVGFILTAMSQDYYPKLASLINEKEKACHLINIQIETALLIAAPFLIGVSTMSTWLIQIAYTDKFIQISPMVCWLALGSIGRIISWPLGFVLFAEGNPVRILTSEIPANILMVFMAWIGIKIGGLNGASASFAIFYLIYWLALLLYVNRRIGFMPNRHILLLIFVITILTTSGFWINLWFGFGITVIVTVYCFYKIIFIIKPNNKFIIWIKEKYFISRKIKFLCL